MSDVIFLSDVRLSFPHLAEPQRQINEQTGKERISYNAEFIMPPDHPRGFKQFYEHYGKLMVTTFAEHASTVMQMIQNDRKLRCFGHGSEKINKKTFAPYDGYPGMVFITAGSGAPAPDDPRQWEPGGPGEHDGVHGRGSQDVRGCRVNAAVKPGCRRTSTATASAATWWRSSSCGTTPLRRRRCGRYGPVRCCCRTHRGPVRPAPRCRRSWEALRRLHRCRQHPSLPLPLAHPLRLLCPRSSGSVNCFARGVRVIT